MLRAASLGDQQQRHQHEQKLRAFCAAHFKQLQQTNSLQCTILAGSVVAQLWGQVTGNGNGNENGGGGEDEQYNSNQEMVDRHQQLQQAFQRHPGRFCYFFFFYFYTYFYYYTNYYYYHYFYYSYSIAPLTATILQTLY
jgi:hypothetical protein